MSTTPMHSFHIPVMGISFTIDTPVKVARYGISSAISIVGDNLIEKMRKHYYKLLNQTYTPITTKDVDYRALRITDYLNLVNDMVQDQIKAMKLEDFGVGSDLDKYFQMLPDSNSCKLLYEEMLELNDDESRIPLENYLRSLVSPGSIDVNIMTKLDRNQMDSSGKEVENGSDALSALRGYANSQLTNSTLVLSAGMNPRLFAYMESINAFNADAHGQFSKKVAIKVSDFRSASVQGKMLAKRGIWVSEYRIESGLNCGGHAFATQGNLLGPILEEFKEKRSELLTEQKSLYAAALAESSKPVSDAGCIIQVKVQGGIGNRIEDQFLRSNYGADGTGWGTPFLLVPEATTVDAPTLKLLKQAKEKDLLLSNKSPLGIQFHYLLNTSADIERRARIEAGKPGSPCTEKYLALNTEFGPIPICTASRTYQKKKITQIQNADLEDAEKQRRINMVLEKECLCIGLCNSAVHVNNLDPYKKLESVNCCPGPNIAYFDQSLSLRNIIDHIYGRDPLIQPNRPHMFVKELMLYVDYWKKLLKSADLVKDVRQRNFLAQFYQNLSNGIRYYQSLKSKADAEYEAMLNGIQDKLEEIELSITRLFKLHWQEV